VAETVVVGGPADQAGLQPGDTLLAVDGKELGSEAGEQALTAFEPGSPVSLAVKRAGRRRTLRVTPEARPSGPHVLRVRLAGGGFQEGGVVRIRIRAGPVDAPMGPVQDWRGPPPAGSPPAADLRAPMPPAPGSASMAWQLGESGGRLPWPGWRSPMADSLSSRMAAFQDSVMTEARARMDSLRTAYRSWARSAARASAALGSGRGIARLAGAEFRPLTPQLAEYFRGADHGLLVLRVLPGTPAGLLGLRPGDVVVRAAGRQVRDDVDLRGALVRAAPQDSVVVEWVRKGNTVRGVLHGH